MGQDFPRGVLVVCAASLFEGRSCLFVMAPSRLGISIAEFLAEAKDRGLRRTLEYRLSQAARMAAPLKTKSESRYW